MCSENSKCNCWFKRTKNKPKFLLFFSPCSTSVALPDDLAVKLLKLVIVLPATSITFYMCEKPTRCTLFFLIYFNYTILYIFRTNSSSSGGYFCTRSIFHACMWCCDITLWWYDIHSFSSLSYDRSKASSKASSPHSAIQSFLFQMRVSSPFLKVIQ